jgi:hypothetical protein
MNEGWCRTWGFTNQGKTTKIVIPAALLGGNPVSCRWSPKIWATTPVEQRAITASRITGPMDIGHWGEYPHCCTA